MCVKGLLYQLNKARLQQKLQFTRLSHQGFWENFTYNTKKKEIPMKLVNPF